MQSEAGDDSVEMLTDEGNECASSHLNINWTHEIVTRLLALREEKLLPSVVIKYFTEHLQDLLALQHTETMNKVISKLKEDGIDPKTLTDFMNSSSPAEASCHAVKSVRRFDAYLKAHFHFIQPQEFIIGVDQYGTPSSCQYVPVLETLKDLLQYEDVYSEVVNGHRSKNTILRDLCDGSVIANNPLFSADPTALQLMLYYDEFTVVNPLGSKVRKYKVGGFYMTLGKLPPKYRTQLKHINLVFFIQIICS
ncbi:MAG: hypothetical protein DSY42_08510 [Aquifex sp.]|nr:MAG: hypothetical protein DSY42_08510 [Aquifex sp.]